MILDEPTNHLDIDSRAALVEALNAYQGAVVLITHDPHLIEMVADRLLLVEEGTVRPFDGDLDDYRRLLLAQGRTERANGVSRKEERRLSAAIRARLAPLRQVVVNAERRIESLQARQVGLETQLADPTLYNAVGLVMVEQVRALREELSDLAKAIAEAEDAWLMAQATLEEAELALE